MSSSVWQLNLLGCFSDRDESFDLLTSSNHVRGIAVQAQAQFPPGSVREEEGEGAAIGAVRGTSCFHREGRPVYFERVEGRGGTKARNTVYCVKKCNQNNYQSVPLNLLTDPVVYVIEHCTGVCCGIVTARECTCWVVHSRILYCDEIPRQASQNFAGRFLHNPHECCHECSFQHVTLVLYTEDQKDNIKLILQQESCRRHTKRISFRRPIVRVLCP